MLTELEKSDFQDVDFENLKKELQVAYELEKNKLESEYSFKFKLLEASHKSQRIAKELLEVLKRLPTEN